ncbi:hypothetical protein M1146_00770 [Patescibacteria group bacterium]|nr:hypothetical protein [Patescibacteria group bacterium]
MKNIKILFVFLIIIYITSLTQKDFLKSSRKPTPIIPETKIPPTNQPKLTLAPTVTSTLVPSSVPSPTKSNIDSFIYPGSIKVNGGENSLVLQSNDDPQAITNWYKEKITNISMNAKSFVQTNTNGNVINKLVGAKPGFKVGVEVSKKSGEGTVRISVTLD